MVCPVRHHSVYAMGSRYSRYEMAYGLAGTSWLMVWPGMLGLECSMAWQVSNGLSDGIVCKTWNMVWHGRYGLLNGMAW